MTAAVAGRDLFYLYRAPSGYVAALRGLSFELGEGEAVTALGPTGSGKTTLLRLAGGFLEPSSGELSVLGRSIDRLSRRERAVLRRAEIGFVRQHYHVALPRELSIEEIVAFPLETAGRDGSQARREVAQLLAKAGLARRAGARPAELSGGEQQRVAVCAAIAKRPRLVLADEPTGELDSSASRIVIELLLELAREERAAALIVSHDPAVAARTDRTIHVRDGRLAAEGASSPELIVDDQGWLRLPRRLREQAGVGDRVRAEASPGTIALRARGARREQAAAPSLPVRVAERQAPAEVVLERVVKRYDLHDERPVIDLSWTFEPSRLHVVAGPSGSGKTTLLNLIAALERPDSGEVWAAGKRVDSLSAHEASRFRQSTLGYLSQHSTLAEFMTARENVELGLKLRGFPRDEARRRAEEWLGWVGLGKLMDRRADHLSGGEQRRVALSRALAPGPAVLVADEPTAHLDRRTGSLVIQLLQEVARAGGATVIAASHDADLVEAADGRLLLAGVEPAAPVAQAQDGGLPAVDRVRSQ